MKLYSLRKSKQILKASYDGYKKKWKSFSQEELKSFEEDLQSLDLAILQQNREEADRLARKVEIFSKSHFKKSFGGFVFEIIVALILALCIATLIRQVWFELYEIPTGSMRPTFMEKDHLIVRKTSFGINFPLQTEHLYFDPSLVQRTSIVVFSGENIDLPDTDTTYFWIFPYKKRYIKRLMGKPGDTLYFYGGQIYAIDRDGNDLVEFRDSPWLKNLEYLPFTTFEGRFTAGTSDLGGLINQVIYRHMDKPLGRFTQEMNGKVEGTIFNGESWIVDNPLAAKVPHKSIETYSDFWGFRNFAMARLLTKEQVTQLTHIDVDSLEKGILYLELRHNPSMNYPPPRMLWDENRRSIMLLSPYVTVIPLQEKHLNAIMDNIYTARFVVYRGHAVRYGLSDPHFGATAPAFPGVPDGVYEFYHGKAHRVIIGGITLSVPEDSPLYRRDPENIQKLYNLGIEVSTLFATNSPNQTLFPSRYAYFRDGDLYLLGAPIFKKDDPLLKSFVEREMMREQKSTSDKPYIAFRDFGSPMKEGKIDVDFIRTFGVKVPDQRYVCLGDNHAMSADSRYFGFVPEENLQGSPSLILWPPQDIGVPPQKPYPCFTVPNVTIWAIVLAILLGWWGVHLKNRNKPIFKKLS